MKNILISLHSPQLTVLIEKKCKDILEGCKIFNCSTYNMAIETLMNTTIDLFLIEDFISHSKFDSVMGFELMNKIRMIQKYLFTPIFFFSKLEKSILYAFQTFHCFACLEYPCNSEQLSRQLKTALYYQTPRDLNRDIYFKKDGILYNITMNKIIYIKCSRSGTLILCKGKPSQTFSYYTCQQILDYLDSENFLQCNKSSIVNISYIDHIDDVNHLISFSNTTNEIELGSCYKESLFQSLHIPLHKKGRKYIMNTNFDDQSVL